MSEVVEAKQGLDAGAERMSAEAPRKKPTAAAQRKRALAMHRWLRLGIQVVFLVLAPGVFSGAFNAVKYFFAQIGAEQPIEATSFVALLLAVLAFTVVFGRFFCGYACAFGTLGDVLFQAFDFLRSKTPVVQLRFPAPLVRALSLVKFGVLAGVCAACFFGVWSAVSGYSPWVAFAALLSGSLEGVEPLAFAVLGVLAVGMVVRERFFCQFLCPLGAVFSLMPVLGFSEFTRTRAHCAPRCGKCQESCPVDIWPDADELVHGECISCGRCADACPMCNVNLVALPKGGGKPEDRPQRKSRDDWYLVRGSGAGPVLAKAALLLAVFWLVGATRYL